MEYDSTQDTLDHINRVQELLTDITERLAKRAYEHDKSKLVHPEKDYFDYFTPKMKDSTYGSDEYKRYLKAMSPALEHHYHINSHHPEYYSNGLNGMSLLDLIEMLCDWKAATERHADGNIEKSIQINKDRFSVNEQLTEIFDNTRKELNW